MAIRPSAKYPGQIDTDPNYPFGKARNVTISGDGTGTPLEKDWLNDLFGFEQALLDAAGLSPSGTPDSCAASQYLQALRALISAAVAPVAVVLPVWSGTSNGSGLASPALMPLTETHNVGGFTLSSNTVQVPAAGTYLVQCDGQLQCTASQVTVGLFVGASVGGGVVAQGNGSASEFFGFAFHEVVDIAAPATDVLKISLSFTGGGSIQVAGTRLTIRRLV